MKLFKCFKIGVFVPVIILFSIVFGLEKRILFLYFIGFIHELFHVICSLILKGKLQSFNFTILGFSADIENVDYLDFYKQILIYLAGPFSYFLSFFIIFIMYNFNMINEYYYNVYNEYNLTFNLFNLLPIYPLDGGRILDSVYKRIMPIKRSLKLRKIWSILGIIPLMISLVFNNQILLCIFFFLLVILDLKNVDKEYDEYLKRRLMINNVFPIKFNDFEEIYHFNNNVIFIDGNMYEEEEYIIKKLVHLDS